jgi:endonuclease/exonuclease/phosphatase family metal-dependent hydrolase
VPLLLGLAACRCALAPNYEDPAGPRYAGDFVTAAPVPGELLRVVAYNLALGEEVDIAIAALSTPPLAQADVVLMQEMDAGGVERIARALGLRYVYYPAFVQRDGDDFGNAVLTRWPILADRKVLLPHYDPYVHSRRAGVLTVLDLGGGRPAVVGSVHTATFLTGLGARLDQAQAMRDAVDATDAAPPGALRLVAGDFNTPDPGSLDQTVALYAERGYAWASEGAGPTGHWLLGSFTSIVAFARGADTRARGVYAGESGSDHQPIWVELTWPR